MSRNNSSGLHEEIKLPVVDKCFINDLKEKSHKNHRDQAEHLRLTKYYHNLSEEVERIKQSCRRQAELGETYFRCFMMSPLICDALLYIEANSEGAMKCLRGASDEPIGLSWACEDETVAAAAVTEHISQQQ